MTELPEYRLERVFSAPREIVWKAWTDPTLLNRWYGPGVETVIHEFNLVPGGEWRNEMKYGGKSDYQKMVFAEVSPPTRLVWHHSPADENWNIASNPMMPDWPRNLLTTVTFDAEGDSTRVTLTQVPVDATAAEIACFADMMSGMDGGWGKGYAIVDEILAELCA